MKTTMFLVDAFTGEGLAGNRAAVCLLDRWFPDEVLQGVATKNALSETAYLVQDVNAYDLRWFTPTTEVDLCGHATLASAHVVFAHVEPGRTEVSFKTRSGHLGAKREGEIITLDFPVRAPVPAAVDDELADALGGLRPAEVHITPAYVLAVFESEESVRVVQPDMDVLRSFDRPYMIVTAPGTGYDFVSRFFAPQKGVDEDPVTGSAHCVLAPYWAGRLGKTTLHAAQISENGGELFLALRGDRVSIGGRVEPYLEATIEL
jgi:PhzF family phenazine biosynthesis protein